MNNVCLGIVFAVAAAVPILAQQTDDADTKSRVIALEQLLRVQTLKTKDAKTLGRLLDDNFLSVTVGGKLQTKAEALAFVRSAEIVDYLIESITVRIHGDTAVATGIYQIRGLLNGKLFFQRSRFVDTWLLHDKQWLVVASLSTPTG